MGKGSGTLCPLWDMAKNRHKVVQKGSGTTDYFAGETKLTASC